ncbi:MAG: Rieske (2Fe-2S) protein [Hyphomicrobiales bacterium]
MAWQKVASLDGLRDGEAAAVKVGERDIAVFRLGDDVYATSGICPHASGSLAEGFVERANGTVECPLHQALFDVRTGKVLSGCAEENLEIYTVKIDGREVLIDIDAATK